MGFTKKQCREQKKAHFAHKIYHKKSPKRAIKENQNILSEQAKESADSVRSEQ